MRKRFWADWRRIFGLLSILSMLSPIGAYSVETKSIEDSFNYITYYASATVAPATFALNTTTTAFAAAANGNNVWGFDWSVYVATTSPVSGSQVSTFQIATATHTFSAYAVAPTGFNNSFPAGEAEVYASSAPWYSTGPVMALPPNLLLTGHFYTQAMNPVITLQALQAGSTFYLWSNVGQYRLPQ